MDFFGQIIPIQHPFVLVKRDVTRDGGPRELVIKLTLGYRAYLVGIWAQQGGGWVYFRWLNLRSFIQEVAWSGKAKFPYVMLSCNLIGKQGFAFYRLLSYQIILMISFSFSLGLSLAPVDAWRG